MIKKILFSLALTMISNNILANEHCPRTLDFNKRFLASDTTIRLCDQYRNHVLLVVNTASYCGFTSQFEGLEMLYQKYRDKNFTVLGFPSNDFFQEPKGEDSVKEFCSLTYNVKFPMFEKSRVAKRHAEPFFKSLGEEIGEYPKWNFYKYLISREGKVISNFSSSVKPDNDELILAIESLL